MAFRRRRGRRSFSRRPVRRRGRVRRRGVRPMRIGFRM